MSAPIPSAPFAVILLASTSLGVAASLAACVDDSSNGANVAMPDASALAVDGALPSTGDATVINVTPPDAAPKEAGIADSTAADAVADAVVDVNVPPACVDAGALGDAATDAGPDAGCYGALAVFNTGVGTVGPTLDGGTIDPHYALTQSADTTFPGPNAVVVTQIADGYWLPQSAESKWIAPSENQAYPGATPCNAAGTYVYRTTFSLAGFDPNTAVIQGKWAADNSGAAVRLNGTSLGITASGYSPFTPFTIASGFNGGTNTLDFEIGDLGCPNGLRVELSGFARVLP